MIDGNEKQKKQAQKARVLRRYNVEIDEENYEFIPPEKQVDYYDNDVNQRVAIYVRVSTDDVRQTTSFELQKKYYEDFVKHHPNWTLVNIYADEGISGTSLKHRDAFNQMISDAKSGKIDLIITKSVSRFARNIMITIGMVRSLEELKPPVGVYFESEHIFSLDEDSQMALSFQATMAEEESHTRSRSMEASLRMRLDHGIPLTPKLLGYSHDSDGHLIINPDEAPTVKLAFYMYLYGYSSQQIADALIALGRKSYLGNIKWTAGGVVQILRNERHCGDVFTRKTYTENYRTHRTLKNKKKRGISRYYGEHEAIVSRDDYIAVQRMLDNAKYGNKSILPELRVIDQGIFHGFVTINPRWAGFKEAEYFQASRSVYELESLNSHSNAENSSEIEVSVAPGDFDMRGFQFARTELFDTLARPTVTFWEKKIKFSSECVNKFSDHLYIELLINPISQQFAIRPSVKENRNAVLFGMKRDGKLQPRIISSAAFHETIYKLFDWNPAHKYRIIGQLYEQDGELAYIFDAKDREAYLKSYVLPKHETTSNGRSNIQPLTQSGKHIRAIPQEWMNSFGKQFYVHEQSLDALDSQSETDWKLRLEGQLFETGKKLNVTSFEELRRYIRQELSGVTLKEGTSHNE